MNINRSGYYSWKKSNKRVLKSEQNRDECINLIEKVRKNHLSHGYRWIRNKIIIEFGVIYSYNYIWKCCKWLNYKAHLRRVKYKRPKEESVSCPNLKPSWSPSKPLEVITSDMTILKTKYKTIELTLYIDAFNNEIIGYGIGKKQNDPVPYYEGLKMVEQRIKKEQTNHKVVLHTDQGSVYSSIRFNTLCNKYNIIHSMSRKGTPTDNPMDESINGWIKDELYNDFYFFHCSEPEKLIKKYIHYWNYKRLSFSLDYKTPIMYKHDQGFF